MAEQPIPVSKARGAREVGEEQDASALKPGALTGYDNNEWTFSGNGQITPTQVMTRIIEIEASKDKELAPFVGNRDAARFTASANLQKQNAHLGSLDPNKAVPEGAQFHANGGSMLKELLSPFKNNLDKLRAVVDASSVGLGGENKAIGAVRRNSASIRGLPTDPKI